MIDDAIMLVPVVDHGGVPCPRCDMRVYTSHGEALVRTHFTATGWCQPRALFGFGGPW
jgi:hypothetical protein